MSTFFLRALLVGLLLWPVSLHASAPSRAAPPPRQLTPPPQRHWFHPSYLFDWGLALALGAGAYVAFELLPPPEREWIPGDPSLSQPLRGPLLPDPVPLLLAFGVPTLGLALAQIGVRSGHDFHHAMLGLTQTFALTFALVGGLNAALGRLRPDWIERCQPSFENLSCNGDADAIREGRRSFPSRAASFAFAGGAYLSYYLADKLRLLSGQGALWKWPLVLTPLTAALLLGVAQVAQHQNHPEDVLVGALLGAGIAYLCFRLNFSPSDPQKPMQPHRRLRVALAPSLTSNGAGLTLWGHW